jgi:hypothetical protein
MPPLNPLQQTYRHERLTTQNLLISAAFFERTPGRVTRQTLADLAALIDLYCLFDRIVVLGRGTMGSIDSELLDELGPETVAVEEVKPSIAARVAQRAAAHVAACLAAAKRRTRVPESKLRGMFASITEPGTATCGLTHTPDTPEDLAVGMRAIASVSAARLALGEPRAYAFARRSFLYVAYAEESGRLFTPDLARVPLVENIVKEEGLFREQLLATLKTAWATYGGIDQTGITRVVPALAGIVFDRASPDVRRISREMRNLRDELAPTRRRLRESETRMHAMTGPQAAEEEKVWRASFQEIARAFGSTGNVVTKGALLNTLPEALKVVAHAKSPAAWVSALSKLPADVIGGVLARRRVVELHKRLRRGLPSPARLTGSVRELFNEIAD